MNYEIEKTNKKIVFLIAFILFSSGFAGMTFAQAEIDTVLEKEYVNDQCLLCYDLSKETAVDLRHRMREKITINKSGVVSSKNTLKSGIIKILEAGHLLGNNLMRISLEF